MGPTQKSFTILLPVRRSSFCEGVEVLSKINSKSLTVPWRTERAVWRYFTYALAVVVVGTNV